MYITCEEKIQGHSCRRGFNSKKGTMFSPKPIPTYVTKETMRSAFNEYFAEVVYGETEAVKYAVQVVQKIKEKIEDQSWQNFTFTTDETGYKGGGYRAEIFIDATKIEFRIKIRLGCSILIKDESFDPGESAKLKRFKKFWYAVVNA